MFILGLKDFSESIRRAFCTEVSRFRLCALNLVLRQILVHIQAYIFLPILSESKRNAAESAPLVDAIRRRKSSRPRDSKRDAAESILLVMRHVAETLPALPTQTETPPRVPFSDSQSKRHAAPMGSPDSKRHAARV